MANASASQFGRCATGNAGDVCLDESDCWSKVCVADVIAKLCRDGMPRSACTKNSDCLTGTCALYDQNIGFCTAGGVGDPCHAGDCKAGTSCVLAANFAFGLGTCLAGQTDDACDVADQCASKHCLDNRCVSGALRAPCKSGNDCLSTFCLLPESALPVEHGTCISGDLGDLCYDAHNCKVGLCTMKHYLGGMGLCGEGKPNDPCVGDADCPGSTCNIPKPAEQAPCIGKGFGEACGDTGVCDPDEMCEFGKCAAAN
jgi:hypothetical protein